MFEIKKLTVQYGAAIAVNSISMTVKQGQVICIVGPNGAGKSTFIRAICRQIPACSGEIYLNKCPLHQLSTDQITNSGIIQCPEGRNLFGELTVKENIILGSLVSKKKWRSSSNQETLESMLNLFPRIKMLWNRKASVLSGGEQQMVALTRSVMGNPKVLLLDEPSLGLAPIFVKNIMKAIPEIVEKMQTSIILVEQNVHMSLKVSSWSYWLQSGNLVFSGSPKEMRKYLEKR